MNDLHRRRRESGYDGPALLLLDGCTCHDREALERKLEDENVLLMFIPPHSSDQIQVLDLGIFGVMKQRMAQIKTDVHLSHLSRQVVKSYNAWQIATLPSNISGAFRRAGIHVEWKSNEQRSYIYVDERTADAVRHFQRIPEWLIEPDRRRTRL